MNWKNLGEYLNRFKNLGVPGEFVVKETAKAIESVLGIKIEDGLIKSRPPFVFVKTKNSSLKNSIFLNKNKILDFLNNSLGEKTPKDIKFG